MKICLPVSIAVKLGPGLSLGAPWNVPADIAFSLPDMFHRSMQSNDVALDISTDTQLNPSYIQQQQSAKPTEFQQIEH